MSASMSPTRRRFLEFLVSVAALHIVAITLYYALDVGRASGSTQRWYAWIWMGSTVVVVLVGLQRIKRARLARLANPLSTRS